MNQLNKDLLSFHKNRIQSCMNDVKKDYILGKRIFDKYDIEDNWHCFEGLILEDAQFTNCIIEACFTNCNFNNAKFLNCNLKTVSFEECDLTNVIIDECSIEGINLENSLLEGLLWGSNYAYGNTVSTIV